MQIKSKIIYSFNEKSEMETQKTEQQKDKRQPNPQLRANAFVCSREKSMKHLIKISSVSRHGCNFVSSNVPQSLVLVSCDTPVGGDDHFATNHFSPRVSINDRTGSSTKPRSNASPSSRGA